MKYMTKTRLSVVLTALLLTGTAAFAQLSMSQSQPEGRKVATTIDSTTTLRIILSAKFDEREELLAGIESRVRTADSILSALTLPDSAKDELKNASQALTEGIAKSRNSTAADWEKVRAELSDRYSAYAQAAVRAEQAAAAIPPK
jgi:hypothetical protein